MSVSEQEWRDEQERVDRVVKLIKTRITGLQSKVSETKEEIVDIRKNFWEDVTVNFDEFDDVLETYVSLRQQAEVLSERERTHRHATKQLHTLRRLERSPYFGRIDFLEEGETSGDTIYLGIGSLVDDDGENFLIYDWRAPVSSLYYDYSPGPAKYETPSGTIEGEMELKRQYMIKSGEIQALFDTGVTIGDQLLQKVLGKHADAQMKSIVATIQREQNQIIRNEQSPLLIVQGAAGSGKTSAALQRVAYLLYRYREVLSAENIVLFSPNPMFNSYVSTVLPELGEENMQQTTFSEYLEHRLGKNFAVEDPFDQMEYTLTAMNEPGYEARIEGLRYKATLPYRELIEQYVEYLGTEALIFRDIKFRGEMLLSKEQLQAKFYAFNPSLRMPNRMKLLADWLVEELKQIARKERKKPWVEDEIELLDNEEYLKAYQKLRKQKGFSQSSFDDFEREKKLLGKMLVKERFKPLLRGAKKLRFLNVKALYRQLFSDPHFVLRFAPDAELPSHWPTICEQTVERLERGELGYEDATPFLYFKELLEGFQTNTSVRHVFVDEAQDYSLFQFAFFRKLFPRAKLTLLGDLNQSIFAHAAADQGFAPLLSLFGEEEAEMIVLKRSYRSTRPIIEFTREMIAGGEQIEAFNREGNKPTVTSATDETDLIGKIRARIRDLQAEGHGNIAVICKTAQESQQAYDRLQEHLPIRLIGKHTASFEEGLVVIPAYLAKGVEFDAVIVYNAAQEVYGRESERKLFYTACTRAMHELHLYSVGEITSFVGQVPRETYVRN
ncbi:MAG TPA: RNA polymerase recycling motor HelD [Bacilli bacterium]|nr:RNA polymerase recycling motor HelD [Bacilli bacterium]